MFEKLKNRIITLKGKKPELQDFKDDNSVAYLSAEYLRDGKLTQFAKIDSVSDKYFCTENDLLIIWDGSNSGEVFMGKEGILSSTMAKIEVNDNLYLKKYLYYFLKNNFAVLNEKVTGAAIPHLNRSTLENLEIYKASLPEQKEIVDVLDAASEIIRLRTACIESAQSLIPALFQKMFGDIKNNVKNWKLCNLNDLVYIDRKNISVNELKTNAYRYIGLEHIEKDTGKILIDLENNFNVDLKSNKYYFTNEHVLYGKLRPYLNKVALPTCDGVCSTDIFPIMPRKNMSNKYFIKYLMSSPYFVQITSLKTSGANLPRIGTKALELIKVICPDIEIQNQFASKVQEIETYIKTQQAELENAKTMFQSLLHYAFMGKLTENITFEVKNE